MRTLLVFGDQLNREIGAMASASPDRDRILLIESDAAIGGGRHRQRLHLVLTAMRRFASDLESVGFEVDHRRAATMAEGLQAHVDDHDPDGIVATEPNSRRARSFCDRFGIDQRRSTQFLCHPEDFAAWAGTRSHLRLEDFYRWQRSRLGLLMDEAGGPVGGRWNLDAENREPPPSDPSVFPRPPTSRLDDVDHAVLDRLGDAPGAEPVGLWATSRRAALARLRHFVEHALPLFGRYEDAMTSGSWHLAHSLLSPYLNLGLLLPAEVCERVEAAYREGSVPLNSAEGCIRQIIGWREYVWGLYWLWPDHAATNHFDHDRELPPVFTGEASTHMRCLDDVLAGLDDRGWVHHIPRLMVLSNLANLAGVRPQAVLDWMLDRYIDAAEWVMIPNVMGMALWADGGRMATKPYISGGAYINRMSDYCGDCVYNPRSRTGDDACPFTTLYWEFLDRHRDRLGDNARLARPLANLDRLGDLPEVRRRAAEVHEALARGEF